MKIVILSNRDLASCLALNQLLPALQQHNVSVFLSSSVGGKSKTSVPLALQHLKFFEQSLFNDILFPLLAASHGHKSARLHNFDELASLTGKPVIELNRINAPDEFAVLAACAPDLIISIRYGVILKNAVIALPKLGVLNLHSGLLPNYKGVMATFRALLNGDTSIGTTLHWIDDSNIDTGRIVGTTAMPVNTQHSYLWHVLALYREGCKLLLDAVAALDSGTALPAQEQQAGGNYYSFPTDKELAAFHAAGWTLVQPRDIDAVTRQFMGE